MLHNVIKLSLIVHKLDKLCRRDLEPTYTEHIRKTKVPHKVVCFEWLLANEAAFTLDNLMRRGIPLCSRCFLCKETADC